MRQSMLLELSKLVKDLFPMKEKVLSYLTNLITNAYYF